MVNQKWTIQRNWQYWAQDTGQRKNHNTKEENKKR